MDSRPAISAGAARPASAGRRRSRALAPWLYLLPAFAVYAVFWAGPAAYSLYLSFFDWDMASPIKTFVAFDSYRRVLTEPLVWVTLGIER